jgi:hypothetical protein
MSIILKRIDSYRNISKIRYYFKIAKSDHNSSKSRTSKNNEKHVVVQKETKKETE